MGSAALPGFDPTQYQQQYPPIPGYLNIGATPAAAPGVGAPPIPGMPSYGPDMGVMNNITTTQNATAAGANQINTEATDQLNHYGSLENTNEGLAATALQNLNQTPGYTSTEASAIDPNFAANKTSDADLSKQFLTSGEQSGIMGDPNAPKDTMTAGTAAEGAQLNAYGSNLGGQVSNLASNVGGNLAGYRANLGGELNNLDTGLAGAQDKFSSLDSAVNNPALGYGGQTKQMTDQDVQDMRTAAGTTVGDMYRSSEDQLRRNAAASGETSPLAIAAAQSRLNAQSAAGMGDAEVQAQIQAEQAQAARAQAIEAQRYGETASTAGMKAGAATTEEAAAQNAAALAGTTGVNAANTIGAAGINAAEDVGAAGIDAANKYGTTAVNEASNAANQNYGAAATAEQEAAQRAAALAGNRQQTETGVNATKYGQGMGTDTASSGAATNVANARIGGEAAYRAGVTGQQTIGQTGVNSATSAQNDALKTQTVGLVGSGGNAVNDQGNNQRNSVVNQSATMLNSILGHGKKGAIVTKPTPMVLGEDGKPEMVVPLTPQYGAGRRQREAA